MSGTGQRCSLGGGASRVCHCLLDGVQGARTRVWNGVKRYETVDWTERQCEWSTCWQEGVGMNAMQQNRSST